MHYFPPHIRPRRHQRSHKTAENTTHVSMMVISVKPYRIILLVTKLLSKLSLEKFARAKIQIAVETGAYYELDENNNDVINSYRMSRQETPTSEAGETISSVFCETFELPPNMVWFGTSFSDYGITPSSSLRVSSVFKKDWHWMWKSLSSRSRAIQHPWHGRGAH